MPRDFNLNLTRNGDQASLVSSRLVEAFPYAPDEETLGLGHIHGEDEDAEPKPRAPRHDGWTNAKMRIFLDTLAETGVVADACRAAKMSRDAAYALRNRASGRGFALGWEAALQLSRAAIGDDVMGRARYGVVDKVYRNGELVAERHRYDNRLTMAVLARLDRQAEATADRAPVIRAVAEEWDRFLDLLADGVAGAEEFVAARFPCPDGKTLPVEEPPDPIGMAPAPASEAALLARASFYEEHKVGLPCELETCDLDPAAMEGWTEEQFDRAEVSGFLESLSPLAWPEAARTPPRDGEGDHAEHGGGGPAEANGTCKLRKLYLRYHPQPPAPALARRAEPQDDFAGCSVWEDEDGWRTDFPPPDGFDGWEEGEPGDEDYRRELGQDELAAIGEDETTREDERLSLLQEQHLARARFFFVGGAEEEEAAEEPEGTVTFIRRCKPIDGEP